MMLAIGALMFSCGEKKEEKKEDGFEMNRTKKEESPKAEKQEGVPVDMSNKGVGPIKSLKLDGEINADMVAKGKEAFNKCIACHTVDTRLIGPALKGVMERRSPEWVMNMMLNPDGMLKEDPIAKALFKEYNNALMTNQGLTEEEARSILEYFRTL